MVRKRAEKTALTQTNQGIGLILLGTALLVGGLISFDPPYVTSGAGASANYVGPPYSHHGISYPTWARFGIASGAVMVVGGILLSRRRPPS